MLKRKIGDKVKIKTDLVTDKNYGEVKMSFFKEEFLGKEGIIVRIGNGYYELDIDNAEYCWSDEMLEDVKDKPIHRYKIGDKVRILDNSDFIIKCRELCPNGSIVEINFINSDEGKVWIDKDKTMCQWVDFRNIEPIKDKTIKTTKKPKKRVIENTIRHIIVGRKTIVLSRDSNGKTIKGESIYHKTDDVFDELTGLQYAISRMYDIEPFSKSEISNDEVKVEINKYLLKGFLENKLVINCETEEEAEMFFKYLINEDCEWNGGRNLLSNTLFEQNKENTCYACSNKTITYASRQHYSYCKRKIITYKELIGKPSISVKILSAYSTEELLEEIKSRTK